jgi:hypothetical protein
LTHVITGEENYLNHTLANVGVPPLHILRAHNGQEYRFFELTGDLPEALHFRHFEQTEQVGPTRGRVRIKGEAHIKESHDSPVSGRVKLHD